MKQVIAGIISKRFTKINKLFPEIIAGFGIEAIHEFRTEIKKLRAFLRLLNVEINDDRLKIPKPIKLFYGYTGTIRNLQLQIKSMDAYKEHPQYMVIKIYVEYLGKIIEKWKRRVIDFNYSTRDFCSDETRLEKRLPLKLRISSGKKFMENKMNEFSILLLELPGEEILHDIRKILKDILYNWKFIKWHKELLPSFLSKRKEIKVFTELMGEYLDKHTGVNLLETYCKDAEESGSFVENDISVLQEIESEWKKEKQRLSGIIYSKMGLHKSSDK